MGRIEDVKCAVLEREKFNDYKKSGKVTNIENIIKALQNKDIDNHIKKDNIFYVEIKNINSNNFRSYFHNLYTTDLKGKAGQYVWISVTSDGQPFVVGRTSFKKDTKKDYGDLNKKISLLERRPMEILINLLNIPGEIENRYFIEDKKTNDKKELSIVDIIEGINDKLESFITHAIIIPLDVSSYNYEASKGIVSKIEKEVGNYLTSIESVFLIDKRSHTNK